MMEGSLNLPQRVSLCTNWEDEPVRSIAYERWQARHRAQGWTISEVAAALGVEPAEIWARVWRGELRATEIALTVVIKHEELSLLGLL